MNENTYGDAEVYKMLPFLTEKINLLPDHRKSYVSTFIIDFNQLINKFSRIKDNDFKNYLLDLTYYDYIRKTNEMLLWCDGKIISYLNNFIYAKIKNTKRVTPTKRVAVISLNTDDFRFWKEGNNLESEGMDTNRVFIMGNIAYVKICSVSDLCSNRFDEVIETSMATLNDEYEKIMSIIPGQMTE